MGRSERGGVKASKRPSARKAAANEVSAVSKVPVVLKDKLVGENGEVRSFLRGVRGDRVMGTKGEKVWFVRTSGESKAETTVKGLAPERS